MINLKDYIEVINGVEYIPYSKVEKFVNQFSEDKFDKAMETLNKFNIDIND